MAKRPVARKTSQKSTNSGWFRRFASETDSIPKSATIDTGFNDPRLDVLYDRLSEAEEDRRQIFQGTRQEQNLEFSQAEASRNAIEEARTKEFTKLLVQIKSRFQDAHSARVVVLKEVDEQCTADVQKEAEKQLVAFETRQKSRERQFGVTLDTYKKQYEALALQNEEFLNTERAKRDDAYKFLVTDMKGRLEALIESQKTKFSESQRGRDIRIKDLLATRDRSHSEVPTRRGRMCHILHIRSSTPNLRESRREHNHFSPSSPHSTSTPPTPALDRHPSPPAVTIIRQPPTNIIPETDPRRQTPLIVSTAVTPFPDGAERSSHGGDVLGEVHVSSGEHSHLRQPREALEAWNTLFIDAERERASIFLNDIAGWDRVFLFNESERDRMEHHRLETFHEWEERHELRFSALENLSGNFLAVQKAVLSAQERRRSTEFQVVRTRNSGLFEDLTTWHYAHRYPTADSAQDLRVKIQRNRVEKMLENFRSAFLSLSSRQQSRFDNSLCPLPLPSRPSSPYEVPKEDEQEQVGIPTTVIQAQGYSESVIGIEPSPIYEIPVQNVPSRRPVSPVYPAGPFVPQTLFAQGPIIPPALPIPKVAESGPQIQPRKGVALSTLQQQQLTAFNAGQLRRQARFQAEMKRHHSLFVVNDLSRDNAFHASQARRAETAEKREDRQSQQFEELIEKKTKDVRLLVISSHSDFRTSESERERHFLDDQNLRRDQFVSIYESIQEKCYWAEERRMLRFLSWEGQIREDVEDLVQMSITQFEEEERIHEEEFERILATLESSSL